MKSTVIAIAVAAALGAGSIPAFARDHGGAHHQQQWHQRAGGERHWGGHARAGNWGYAAPRYYARLGYYQPYDQPSYYYGPGYYSYDSSDVIGGAILGALAGGLVGQLAAGR